ncbi:MAG: flagellar M-ring protein FliF, partial [Gammaproteobacteria bacterium]
DTGLTPLGAGDKDYDSGLMPMMRQLGLMISLAASVAFGVALVLWSQTPEMRPLGNMDRASAYEVVSFLGQNEIDYAVNPDGTIMVEQKQYQRVQMELASQGISNGDVSGDAILKDGSGFGVSQQLETARLVRSQEMNLSATIEKFSGISSAQVHLAIPKETVFVSDKRKPSASVLLNMSSTMGLEREQIRAIVDLVAGSIPNLTANRITITDQYGRLHHSGSMSADESQSRKQFEEETKRQEGLHSKIEQILSPILGVENFSVQVNVSMNFVANESTSKIHNADQPSLRSQRKLQSNSADNQVGGVPGALSNQPPGAATIPENLTQNANAANNQSSGNQHSEVESNYEIDTTINHTRFQTATINRISVSVGLNNLLNEDGSGRIVRTAQEIIRIERMIKGVINFRAARGDSVIVDAFDFPVAAPAPELPPLEFYEEELFKVLLKPVVAFIGIILLIFLVFKPMISRLASGPVQTFESSPQLASDQLSLSGDLGGMQLPSPGHKTLAQVDRARSAVGDNPAMVAQVVKNWMESDEQ